MADRELVTDARLRQAITGLDRLNEWLAVYPEQSLEDWDRHLLQAAFNRVWAKVHPVKDAAE